ncbi:MAG: outer membrane protein OmpA-like peptidoglycan-associated protein [Maribacter sp.]|jgi:outer membrane protein OmpA-like peptidoglycan-associated protein
MDIITTYLKEFRNNPDTYIKITSHTSNEGNWESSLDISRKRAIAMADHFKKYGVPQDRIILD